MLNLFQRLLKRKFDAVIRDKKDPDSRDALAYRQGSSQDNGVSIFFNSNDSF